MRIRGRIATGVGQGKVFTRLPWARDQFIDRLGIDPFPGTINVTVADDSVAAWEALKREPGIRIDNPGNGPYDCDARCYPVLLAGTIQAAIVLPEVDGYGQRSIECIAAVGVRGALGISDGDPIEVTVVES